MRRLLRALVEQLRHHALLHRANTLSRRADALIQQRNRLPLASSGRMLLNARALELACEASALRAEAMGDEAMAAEHRVEAAEFGRRARLHQSWGAFA